jgi:AraC family transcriptional regulator of adaptative response / DNA-3-methyladenine glycosylase II
VIPEPEICEQARQSRDPRFDGRFFIAVLTTGIYCRPVCPARTPAQDNVRYYPTAAAAQDAGYRPCMRCRPERAAALATWTVSSDTVIRGLEMINAGCLNTGSIADLAAALGVGTRQLNRLFQDELSASPKSIARMQRLQLARQLIDETDMPFSEVALASGYGSLRRFNDEVKRVFGRPPRILRRLPRVVRAGSDIVLRLPLRQPYDANWVLGFLARRSLAGVEGVEGRRYYRRLGGSDRENTEVSAELGDHHALVTIPATQARHAGRHLARIRRMFDLGADSATIDAHLAEHRVLNVARGGIRVPGAWDGFELAVRAILGQQVSVARARDLANAMIARWGDGTFPSPDQLARADVAALGMPGSRGKAIAVLARRVLDGALDLQPGMNIGGLREQLCAIPGIGPWTAEYVAMRAGRDPDAFPNSDWVVCKYLDATPGQVRSLAAAWRPWRAYALMYLWLASSTGKKPLAPWKSP